MRAKGDWSDRHSDDPDPCLRRNDLSSRIASCARNLQEAATTSQTDGSGHSRIALMKNSSVKTLLRYRSAEILSSQMTSLRGPKLLRRFTLVASPPFQAVSCCGSLSVDFCSPHPRVPIPPISALHRIPECLMAHPRIYSTILSPP